MRRRTWRSSRSACSRKSSRAALRLHSCAKSPNPGQLAGAFAGSNASLWGPSVPQKMGLSNDHQTRLPAPHRRFLLIRRVAQRLCSWPRADVADACKALFIDAAKLACRIAASRGRSRRYPCLSAMDDAGADQVACRTGEQPAAGSDCPAWRLCSRHTPGYGLGGCLRMGAGLVGTEGAARGVVNPWQSRLVGGPFRAEGRVGADGGAPGARERRHTGPGKRCRPPGKRRAWLLGRRTCGPTCAAAGQGLGPQQIQRTGRPARHAGKGERQGSGYSART